MEWMLYVVASLFALLGAACVVLTVVGLPGTWILLAAALAIELLDGLYLTDGSAQTFSWWLLGGCLVLAGIGEVLEFTAGALGAAKAGSSKRGMAGALIGGIVGAIVGAPFLLLIGALIGAIVGTFAGAVIGELLVGGKNMSDTIRPATGATIGRVLGTLSKLPIAIAIWLALSIAAFWP